MNEVKLVLSKNSLATLLLLIVLLSGLIIHPFVAFVESSIIVLIAILGLTKFSKTELLSIFPLSSILIIGIIFAKGETYIIAKDIWYFAKPIVLIMLGFVFARWNVKEKSFIGIIFFVSVLSAMIRIIKFSILSSGDPGLNEMRIMIGASNFLEAYSLAFILSKARFKSINNYLKLPRSIYITLLSISVFLSFSRTGYVVFLIGLLALNNYFSFNLRTMTSSLLKLTFLFIISYSLILMSKNLFNEKTFIHKLSNKFLNSLTEISSETKFTTKAQIINNWRGYETQLAENEIKKGTLLQKLIGFGFGKTVFIGYEGWLGPTNINIPILHNGFIQLKLKTGYLGLFLYLIFFISMFLQINKDKSDKANLLKAVLLSSLFSTLVITGLYNKSDLDTSCIIIGYLFSLIYLDNREKNRIAKK